MSGIGARRAGSAEDLGIVGLNKEQLLKYVQTGVK